MTPTAACVPVLLTTNRFPAPSNAMSPLLLPLVGTVWGRFELATTPIGWFVVVLNPKMVIASVGAWARYAQKKLPLRGSTAPATMPPERMLAAVTPEGSRPAVLMLAVCGVHASV